MTYATKEDVKDRIHFNGSEFFDINSDTKFDDLLDTLLDESEAIVDGQIGGETLTKETDREDEFFSPDTTTIELVWPIVSISKVEVYGLGGYRELESDRYDYTEHSLRLKPVIRREYGNYHHYQHINPLRLYINRLTWADICTKVRVTYTRGFETIPDGVKETQISIINRMLMFLRQDQNLSAMNPDEMVNSLNNRVIITEDMKERMIGKLSQPQNKYVVL